MTSALTASHMQVPPASQVRGTFYILGWLGVFRRRPPTERSRERSAPPGHRSERAAARRASLAFENRPLSQRNSENLSEETDGGI